jgi:DNA-binding GntR family transcriptional regulator
MENQDQGRNIAGPYRENNDNPSKFKTIAGYYRDRIVSGSKGFEPGDSMPSRREMASVHHTTRPTIDKAMEVLTAEGLIIANGNQRSIIVDQPDRVPSMDDRMAALRATGKILGRGETCEILETRMVDCPPSIAAYLRVEEGSQVLLRTRVTKRNGKPIAVSESYYPQFAVEAAPELAERGNIEGGARELAVYRLDCTQEDAEETFTARMATDREKTLLEVTAKFAVVLQTLRVVPMSDGRVVEAAVKVGEGSMPVRTRRSLRPQAA